MYEVSVYHSFDEVDAACWEALSGDSLYLSPTWLSYCEGTVFQRSGYFLAKGRGGEPVAGLAAHLLPAPTFPLMDPCQLLFPDGEGDGGGADLPEGALGRMRELRRALAPVAASSYPIAVCLVPFGYEAAFRSLVDERGAVEPLLDALERVAEDWGARGVAFLYLSEERGTRALRTCLRERGFSATLLGARCVMPVRWRDFDDYLAMLGSHRRSAVRKELRMFADSGLDVEVVDGRSMAPIVPALAELSARVQEKYGHGFDVAGERWVYERIAERLAPYVRVVLVRDQQRIVAFHLLYTLGDRLYAGLVGQDHTPAARRGFAHFQALYYQPIRLAIAEGASSIDYLIEAQETKVSRGCELRPTYGWVRLSGAPRGRLDEFLELRGAAQRRRLQTYDRFRPRRWAEGANGSRVAAEPKEPAR